MKTYSEWLTSQGIGSNDTDSDTSLVDEQTTMMIQRFAGLLHGLSQQEKSAIVERAISDLKKLV